MEATPSPKMILSGFSGDQLELEMLDRAICRQRRKIATAQDVLLDMQHRLAAQTAERARQVARMIEPSEDLRPPVQCDWQHGLHRCECGNVWTDAKGGES